MEVLVVIGVVLAILLIVYLARGQRAPGRADGGGGGWYFGGGDGGSGGDGGGGGGDGGGG